MILSSLSDLLQLRKRQPQMESLTAGHRDKQLRFPSILVDPKIPSILRCEIVRVARRCSITHVSRMYVSSRGRLPAIKSCYRPSLTYVNSLDLPEAYQYPISDAESLPVRYFDSIALEIGLGTG